jgi:hypothetical protein
MVGGDLVGEVCGIPVDEGEQGRAAGVLPGQSQEVQAGISVTPRRCITRPFSTAFGMWDPGVLGTVAGRPDHHPDALSRAAVSEPDCLFISLNQSRPEPYADLAEPPLVGPDDELPGRASGLR